MATVLPDVVVLGGGLAEAMPELFTKYTTRRLKRALYHSQGNL